MTPEEQRIAIAEFCGWNISRDKDGVVWVSQSGEVWDLMIDELPNYPEDLNAIHEAEKVLTHKQEKIWRGWLESICGTLGGMLHATAAQRAEALLKSIGRWRD